MKMLKLFSMCLCLAVCSLFSIRAQAAEPMTSLGLAEQGIRAYDEKWEYSFGGKGEVVGDHRVSDCAGLICSYFKDCGNLDCMGGATAQVRYNCVMSSRFRGEIPNIHGLTVTMYDKVDPGSGLYGHVGIYAGAGISYDNSTYGTNMVRKDVAERGWNEWHIFDNGLRYPVNGWYEFNGKYVYYEDYEYVTDCWRDGIYLDKNGFSDVKPDDRGLSGWWGTVSDVKNRLLAKGWKNDGGSIEGFEPDGIISGSYVNVREEPFLKSKVVSSVARNDQVERLETVTGDLVKDGVHSSTEWVKVKLASGVIGYVSSLYVSSRGVGDVPIPVSHNLELYVRDGQIRMGCDAGCDVYYTIDGTDPVKYGSLYTEPLDVTGATYRACCYNDGIWSDMELVETVCSNGMVFDDFTSDDWFFDYVDRAVTLGLFTGKGNGWFGPRDNITRGQFCLVLARCMNIDTEGYVSNFIDVPESSYYSGAIGWAYESGIVSGIGHNKFALESDITREQMCVILARAYGFSSSGGEMFQDDSKISDWARESVYACRDRGIISGVGGNKFDPKGISSRAQGATVFVRIRDMF